MARSPYVWSIRKACAPVVRTLIGWWLHFLFHSPLLVLISSLIPCHIANLSFLKSTSSSPSFHNHFNHFSSHAFLSPHYVPTHFNFFVVGASFMAFNSITRRTKTSVRTGYKIGGKTNSFVSPTKNLTRGHRKIGTCGEALRRAKWLVLYACVVFH
jgi:hypothetical protein